MSGEGGRSLLEELEERDLLELARKCARACHVTVEQMLSDDRTHPPSRARASFYAELIATGDWNPHAIGRLVHRHHTTVRSALERYSPRAPASGVVPVAPLASCRPSSSRALRVVGGG